MDKDRPPFQSRDRRPGPVSSVEKMFDRESPRAIEAEMALLGSMILEPKIITDVLGIIGGPEDFYKESHGHIYQSLLEIYDKRDAGDLVQTVTHMRDRGVLDLCGGDEYLVELANSVPTATNAPHFARIVAEKARLRRLIDACGSILFDAYNVGDMGPDGAREVLDRAESAVFEIAQEKNSSEVQALSELLDIEMQRIEAMEADGASMSGVPTGYHDLDNMLLGMQPGEMLILAARPSMGKCLAFDSEVIGPDGSVSTIEEVVRSQRHGLMTLGPDLRIGPGRASAFVDDGEKPVFEVTTRSGRRVRTTLVHPFLTVQGWKHLHELKAGDCVAVPRRLEVFGTDEMRECEVKLLAYLIGDGGLTGALPRFTSARPEIASDFAEAVDEFGGVRLSLSSTRDWESPSWRIVADSDEVAMRRDEFAAGLSAALDASPLAAREIARRVGVTPASVTHWRQGKTAPEAPVFGRLCEVLGCAPATLAPKGIITAQHNRPNPVTAWLDGLGLMGCGAHTKSIPAPVFTLRRPLLAMFLNRLFATDGWASVLASGQSQLGYSTVSERLARQVQHLLLRFGVLSSLRHRWVKYRESRRSAWQVDITEPHSILAFIEQIGIFAKDEAITRVCRALRDRRRRTNTDLIPREAWALIDRARGERSWSNLARAIGAEGQNLRPGKRSLSRQRLAAIARVLGDAPLAALATADVAWDRIESIEPAGVTRVYDLTVPGSHNFIANDICVHNTAMALNIAEQTAMGAQPVPGAPKTRSMPVGFFSLEMSKSSVVLRMLCAKARVKSQDLRGGKRLSKQDLANLGMAADDLRQAPIYIDDTPGLTVLNLRARARRMVQQHGVRALFIDYLQLLSSPGSARESRQMEVSSISRGIKGLARELNVPIVCLSQLNRAAEQREGNRPRMSDLRESGSIEQDADVILLLHREDYYHKDDAEWQDANPEKVGLAEIIIAKQRNGPTGVVKLHWNSDITRFTEYDPHGQAPGGYRDLAGAFDDFGGDAPRAPTPPPAPPQGGGDYRGFSPGKKSGPIDNHRDGGGPDAGVDDFDLG